MTSLRCAEGLQSWEAARTADRRLSAVAPRRGALPGSAPQPAALPARRLSRPELLPSDSQADKSFLGICLGMQLLFDGSEESGGCEGLGLIPGNIAHFDTTMGLPVPHIGWNNLLQK